ncbi:hypothetical protein [Ktedonospora formicarum]|uniref:hypothetical protein n=1 Tax=Ktedonospora formicarum TaxID=2778364 RepID=UPI001C693418|nr:hypothetical protein [Ktedonospora formicarum]
MKNSSNTRAIVNALLPVAKQHADDVIEWNFEFYPDITGGMVTLDGVEVTEPRSVSNKRHHIDTLMGVGREPSRTRYAPCPRLILGLEVVTNIQG